MTLGPRFVCWLWSAALVVFAIFGFVALLAPVAMPLYMLPAMFVTTVVTLPIVEKRRERLAFILGCGVVIQLAIAYGVLYLAAGPRTPWKNVLAPTLWAIGVILPFVLGIVVIVAMIRVRRAERRAAILPGTA
jgi:hypothetical protein